MENKIGIAKIVKYIKMLTERYNKSHFDIGR